MIRHLIAAVLTAFSLGAFAAVDVNQASQAELESVKGIGPALSGKILEARKAGAFRDWNDMVDRVAGIGEGNAARFSQSGLTVAGSPYAAASTAEKPARSTKAAEKAEKTTKADTAPQKAP